MILLKKVRLINWYAFTNVTAPIGFFTLIAGKNGNGKSVMLDAIKYAAYGDTVFNKSSENKGSRTLPSYTRGLLDATAKTYMRPADKVPNVYSHIVLEYYDDVLQKYFLLGTVLETNVSNSIQSYRYVMDQTRLDEVGHLYEEKGKQKPYSAGTFQKKYGVILLNKEQGIGKFTQMTGLKLTQEQTSTYLRKLRGIMSYDPNARIDQFIRESVLENKPVDFTKLIEAKENIGKLNDTFHMIQDEIEELDGILTEFERYETQKNRLLTDDIKIVYKNVKGLKRELGELEQERQLARRKKQEAEELLEVIQDREKENAKKLRQVETSLDQLDCIRLIRQEEERLEALEKAKKTWKKERDKLDRFQTQVSEMIYFLNEEQVSVESKEILAGLSSKEYAPAEKENAVVHLKGRIDKAFEEQVRRLAELDLRRKEIEDKIEVQLSILDACRKNRNAYSFIPDYVSLKEEINREFVKRGILSEAKFACEYVIGLKDEAWRDAIEAFLGRRRYTILVEPEYYEIADDILNRSKNKYAHLFNTKLLMKKQISAGQSSAAKLLTVKNPVAQKYFDFQLGHIKAVPMAEVKNYENAMSVEGRVSIAMDSYFLRFDRIKSYYLGQETFELNRIRAEREIEFLKTEKKTLLEQSAECKKKMGRLRMDRELFQDYKYDAYQEYQSAATHARECETTLKRLKDAQKNNREFMELSQLKAQLEDELTAIQREKNAQLDVKSQSTSQITVLENTAKGKTERLQEEEKRFQEYQLTEYAAVQRAVEAYERYLANHETGAGGLIIPDTRRRIKNEIQLHEREILTQQAAYNAKRPGEAGLSVGLEHRAIYESRKAKIWMDDLQEIKQKLTEQTSRYEDIFKNEFVLTILRSCLKSIEDLELINGELAKLQFSAKYQFDVHFVKDQSDYAKVIEYAKYLDEREQFGGSGGQMVLGLFNSYSDEAAGQLEKDIKEIINRIIARNNNEAIERFADYRNYMTYEILITNDILDHAKLSRQTGYNSGAEVQIPYLLILSSALLMIYNEKVNSTRLVFIDEPFVKMDPGNVKLMLDFMRDQNLQVIFCAPDKTESIGCECEVILPVLRVRPNNMQLGIIQFHEDKGYGTI